MYSWTGDVSGKVWASGATYDVEAQSSARSAAVTSATTDSYTATAWDIGANVNIGNLGLTGYYYDTDGVGATMFGGFAANSGVNRASDTSLKKRDGDGGYVQATYVIPTGTKLGLAYGRSNLDEASGETAAAADGLLDSNERWTVGAYHPLTKHLNLVAEYNSIESNGHGAGTNKTESDSFSLGAILFF